jgi:hypothetical protein
MRTFKIEIPNEDLEELKQRLNATIGELKRLGYDHFAAQGGDIDAGVSMWLARLFPRNVVGVHLNYVPPIFNRL